MKRVTFHTMLITFLLLLAAPHSWSFTSPATIWFLDGTILDSIYQLSIDSAKQIVIYMDRNKFKTAYFDEIFAITTGQDTIIVTPVEQLKVNGLSMDNNRMFMLLKGIHDGLRSKHYRTFFSSLAVSYLSNLAFCGQNVIVRNVPNLVNFFYQCTKPVHTDKIRTFYDIGYNIGLQKRKILETGAGIVAGLYLELLTEAALTSTGN